MNTIFHAGELAVQAKAGVQAMAQQVGQSIKSELPRIAKVFLQEIPFAIVASQDTAGRVWASLLTGTPGFIQMLDKQTVQINASPRPEDPLYDNLRHNSQIGLLVIDFATRRRMRINGDVQLQPDNTLLVSVKEAYSNCPKYIQARHLTPASDKITHLETKGVQTSQLSGSQQQWLSETDTFFIASLHPEGNADASHRGGKPGFVSVVDANRVVWPDYSGNTMFNTLGNIATNPQAGLLVFDFQRGAILQLTGQAAIIWDETEIAKFPGAERLVSYHIDTVIETELVLPLAWHFESFSPFNP